MLYLILHLQGGAVSVLLSCFTVPFRCSSILLPSGLWFFLFCFCRWGSWLCVKAQHLLPLPPSFSNPPLLCWVRAAAGCQELKLCVKAQHFLPCCLICFFPPHCVKAQRHRLVALLACLFLPHCVKAQRLFTAWIYPWHCPLSPSVLSHCGALLP